MTTITIPPEALEAAAKAIATVNEPIDKWLYHVPEARTAIAASLNAWPGAHLVGDMGIYLPLHTENPDAES